MPQNQIQFQKGMALDEFINDYGSETKCEQALENAGYFMKESHAGAVKVEGGSIRIETIRTLVENGIPVMGHIGLTPQSVHQMGGYKVQGKHPKDADILISDAHALVEAGIFALVLECVPAALAAEITAEIAVPTIGIGAGPNCDGQILVTHDMLGLHSNLTPSFAKRYAELGRQMSEAFASYRDEVVGGEFPADKHSF